MTLKNQLLCLLFGTLVGVIALQIIYFNRISSVIYDKNNDYTSEIMANVESGMIDELDALDRIVASVAYNDTVQRFLLESNSLNKYVLYTEMTALLEKMKGIKRGIVDFVLVGENGNSFNLGYDAKVQEHYREVIEQLRSHPMHGTGVQYAGVLQLAYNGTEGMYLLVASPIRGIGQGSHYGDIIGTFFMLLDAGTLSRTIEDISEKTTGYFYILDESRVILASNDTTRIGLTAEEPGGAFIVTEKTIPGIGFTMVSVLPKNELYGGIEVVRSDIVMLLAILMLVLLIVYLLIARNLVRPLGKLFHFLQAVKRNGETAFNERVELEGYMEIHVLAAKFNQMLDEIGELTGELLDSHSREYELQLLRQQAEIAFLNSQINPHFLYNTLETIQGIAAVRGVREIMTMTSALSGIFRYSIQEQEEVALREELEIVRKYLEIQQIRFEDRFEVAFDIDDSLMGVKVKKMLLQPLIENAVFHGLELMLGKGLLTVRVCEGAEGDLRIAIADNGTGIASDRLEELRESLLWRDAPVEARKQGRNGIGVANVGRRIRGAYGEPYGLTIESEQGAGTTVILRLPGRGGANVFGSAGG
ncbi:cache domain-containing sensor histidine kinase [Cohnella fermenti]|uniref:histidine kinase n=1 Tax=Cohnella fermenti TaxID=2565925 RepID=A0A4S4BLX0_9BACL|nr:sensor histidine kinase [Cohnella fermenti]THF75710.1 sensor histidine kinase [Cohnella fermenti]